VSKFERQIVVYSTSLLLYTVSTVCHLSLHIIDLAVSQKQASYEIG